MYASTFRRDIHASAGRPHLFWNGFHLQFHCIVKLFGGRSIIGNYLAELSGTSSDIHVAITWMSVRFNFS